MIKIPLSLNFFSISEDNGLFVVDFVPVDVGTYVMDVLAGGEKVSESPVLYKVYDASLIRITEANSGVVGQPCQFRLVRYKLLFAHSLLNSSKFTPASFFLNSRFISLNLKFLDIFIL